ncbi:dynein heavy chain 5, axonemal-like [Plakobranchus ocellatus]|uniref:Dynein heavy chain 5, axonemal-like n=1 Tax=Plakobranchus ocellatus TaxID=259542 RepID=A0AAV3Y342_9GAST|nr:dynein heavy chain 5, axonemal-like [Plakobranchus ocellatus]
MRRGIQIQQIILMLNIDKEFSPLEQCSMEGMDVHAARFSSLLNNLRKKGLDLLNYRNMAFDEDFDKFLELIEDLKAQLQKFMNTTLVGLKHSLDRLDMMNRFSALNLSFLDIEEGYMNILTIYVVELEQMMQIYERDKDDPAIPWNLPPISGRIYWVRHMLTHIAEPLFRLQKSRPSVMKTPEGKRITYKYNKFAFVLAKTEVLFHVAWFKSLDAASDCLQVPILARHPVTKDALINFDPYVFEVVKEAFYMVKLGLPVPRAIINIIHACTSIITTYRKLQMQLVEYDHLKQAIPEMFWPLMQPSIFKIDSLFYPAFTSITWTSLELPAFFKDLEKAFREMGLFIKTVCDIKYSRIDAKLNQIADTPMCYVPSTEPWTVAEFMQNTKEHTLALGENLNKMNKMICDTVYELLRFFVNNAFQEYKAIESMYAQDQKIADHESRLRNHRRRNSFPMVFRDCQLLMVLEDYQATTFSFLVFSYYVLIRVECRSSMIFTERIIKMIAVNY